MLQTSSTADWKAQFRVLRQRLAGATLFQTSGQLMRLVGMTLEAHGCQAPVGMRCLVVDGAIRVEAQVVGFDGERTFLIPLGDSHGIPPGARVIPLRSAGAVEVGDGLLGRVIDGLGRPLDDTVQLPDSLNRLP